MIQLLPYVETDDNNPDISVRKCIMFDDQCQSIDEVADCVSEGKPLGKFAKILSEDELIDLLMRTSYSVSSNGKSVNISTEEALEALYNPEEPENSEQSFDDGEVE